MVTNADSARLKVDDILRSRGFGKSTEDISKILEKRDEIVGLSTTVTTTTIAASGESTITTTEESTVTTTELSQLTHVELESKSSDTIDTLETVAPSGTLPSDINVTESNENTAVPSDESHSASIPDLAPNAIEEVTVNNISNGTSSMTLEESPSSVEPPAATADGNDAIPCELTDAVEELKLSDEGGEMSLNDTNNNKDFVVDNALSSPVVLNAWSDNSSSVPANDSMGKLSNHVEVDSMNGTEEKESVLNGTNDFHTKEDVSERVSV